MYQLDYFKFFWIRKSTLLIFSGLLQRKYGKMSLKKTMLLKNIYKLLNFSYLLKCVVSLIAFPLKPLTSFLDEISSSINLVIHMQKA